MLPTDCENNQEEFVKKHVLTGLVLLTASVGIYAAVVPICNGGAAQQAAQVPVNAFVRVAFTPRCSNNVILSGEDKTFYYATAAASQKGRSVYVGSTASGAIVIFSVLCASANACTTNDVSQGQTVASAISV